MARFLVKASEFKNVCKAVNDRKLAELKKEIIEILKKQDENEVKKAIDYFNSQELHYTHLEKSLVSGKWIEKAGYGIGTVRIWKGKKYKKIAPGKWARVFDKEGRGTNIAIGKLIAEVEKIQSVEELMDFVMAHKQRFVDDNGMDLPILNKLRAAVDIKNEKLSGESSPYVYGVGENVNRAKNEIFSKKDKIKKEEADLHKVSRKLSQIPTTELKQEKARLERAVANKTRSKRDSLNNVIFRESNQEKLDAINKELEKRRKETSKPAEKKEESKNPVRLKHVVSPIEFTDNHGNKIRYEIDEVKNAPEDYQNPVRVYKVEGNVRTEIAGNVKNYEDAYSAVMEQVEKTKEGTTETEKKYIDESIKTLPKEDSKGNKIEESEAEKKEDENKTYWIQDSHGNRLTNEDAKSRIIDNNMQIFKLNGSNESRKDMKIRELKNENEYLMDRLNPEDKAEVEIPDYASKLNSDESRKLTEELERLQEGGESEAEKTQNRSDAMKGNKNARKFGADWEEKRKEIQSKLSANLDKMLEGHDKAKDVYEKLQSNLDKRKADAELYRKYLGNQEEPEDVKDFRKWCDDVIEQYRKEVTNTPSKEIISKWEETAKNTPTEKLEEVYNGKQKVDYTNYYENYIDSTIINTFAKDKDLIFPQPYTMLKDIATRKFDNSDKIRLEIIKKELESRKNKMEKSLFDDFIVDVFAADDEKELEKELYAGETEYNDYSAEQPELFNSTSMKVREALDRIKNQVL